jgi:hypothetical protein
LIKIEAIKIEGSPPAPLLTLIKGPSAESLELGESKKDLSERHTLRKEWWIELLAGLQGKTKLHANLSPGNESWMGTGAGKADLPIITT